MNSQKILLWQLALSIAFGKMPTFSGGALQPIMIVSSYDVFGKSVGCYLKYSYDSIANAPLLAGNGREAFAFGTPVLSYEGNSSGAMNITPPPPNGVIGMGLNADPQYLQKQVDFVNFMNAGKVNSGINRMYLGPGPTETLVGGNWPAWSASYGGAALPEFNKVIATDVVGTNPGPTYDTGSRDWLGIAIAAALAAYPQNNRHPVNLDYVQGAIPQQIPVSAEQPLINYPAINPQSLILPTTWPAASDPFQVNNSDPNQIG